jgi:prepilin-type N-terminal cleavage/methylation domain-containing protein
MNKIFRNFRCGQKGFTLIELLVVIAILAVLAAVAIPNIGKFIGRGKTESYQSELHNVQTGIIAMMADAASNTLATTGTPAGNVTDLHTVTIVSSNGTTLFLNSYMTGLNSTSVKQPGVSYSFISDGTVVQNHP